MSKTTLPKSNQELNVSFRAKSAGVSLVVIFMVGVYYLVNMLGLLPSDEAPPDGALRLILTSAVLVTVIEIVLQIVLVIGAGKVETASEEEALISMQASRNAHLVLRAGVVIAFLILFAKATLFMIASTLLLAFFLAEIVRFGSQVFYYQRAA